MSGVPGRVKAPAALLLNGFWSLNHLWGICFFRWSGSLMSWGNMWDACWQFFSKKCFSKGSCMSSNCFGYIDLLALRKPKGSVLSLSTFQWFNIIHSRTSERTPSSLHAHSNFLVFGWEKKTLSQWASVKNSVQSHQNAVCLVFLRIIGCNGRMQRTIPFGPTKPRHQPA